MNPTSIRQGLSYVTNSQGQKTAIQLDLTNEASRRLWKTSLIPWMQ